LLGEASALAERVELARDRIVGLGFRESDDTSRRLNSTRSRSD